MKEYREYLNKSQKELIQKLLKTFIYTLQEQEDLSTDAEIFCQMLKEMNDHLKINNYIILNEP